MSMQLILTQDVANLGKAGELVTVKPGYGRNYLLPRGFAVTATASNKQQLEHNQQAIASRVAKARAAAGSIAERLNGMTLQFERLIGDDEKVFGSVTNRDIAEQLKRAGIDIDHRRIDLGNPVKALGKYEVTIKLDAGVIASLKYWVVGKEK